MPAGACVLDSWSVVPLRGSQMAPSRSGLFGRHITRETSAEYEFSISSSEILLAGAASIRSLTPRSERMFRATAESQLRRSLFVRFVLKYREE
jgi:hypothetical protein